MLQSMNSVVSIERPLVELDPGPTATVGQLLQNSERAFGKGPPFRAEDGPNSQPVTIVNEAFVRADV